MSKKKYNMNRYFIYLFFEKLKYKKMRFFIEYKTVI